MVAVIGLLACQLACLASGLLLVVVFAAATASLGAAGVGAWLPLLALAGLLLHGLGLFVYARFLRRRGSRAVAPWLAAGLLLSLLQLALLGLMALVVLNR